MAHFVVLRHHERRLWRIPRHLARSWYSGFMADISAERAAAVAAVFPQILQAIREGARVDRTCAAHGLDRRDVWAYWSKDPARRTEWYDAMKESADAFLDKAIDAAENAGKDAKAARVQLAAYQWIAEKRDPERYGQRTRADINVRTVDLTRIIQDANARLINQQQGRLINGTDNNRGIADLRAHAQPAIERAALQAAGLL